MRLWNGRRGVIGGAFVGLPLTLLAVAMAVSEAQDKAPPPSPEAVRFFETRIRPVLADNCFVCHGETKPQGNLSLKSLEGLRTGGHRGAALVPGNPDKSWLIKAIRYDDEQLKMPPSKKLSAAQIADLTRWVKMGASWPGEAVGNRQSAVEKNQTLLPTAHSLLPAKHWSFQPVKKPAIPKVKNTDWVRNPVDAFVLAKLEAKGLKPAPPASKQELIRRATYDLTGLPPTPQEVEAFLADKSPKAYEALIDRLLASPRYGEKWGRHWLDLVRFAETNSYERDNPKPNAWRYRDYVIRAFNQDKPYDRFIREQLAGDELPDATHDSLIATGFYRLGIWDDEPTDREQARYDGLDDIVATTGQVFLGMTLDCARCHDHKIDPIPQKDYYRFLSFFQNINHFRNGGPTDEKPIFRDEQEKREYERKVRELEAKREQAKAAVTEIETEFRSRFSQEKPGQEIGDIPGRIAAEGERTLGKPRFEEYKQRKRRLEELTKEKVPVEMVLCVTEAGRQAPDTFVLLRGNAHVPGDKVEPGTPEILGASKVNLPSLPPDAPTCGRRLALANWIAAPGNRMTTRVVVNRLWQHHFGHGIVHSSNNFGLQADKPTHLELLDWLAATFVEGMRHEARGMREKTNPQLPTPNPYACNWSFKKMHRMLMTSNTYRMSSRGNPKALAADPTNELLWRFDMRRLTAEEIRDTLLAVNGSLNLKMYGPGIYPEMPKEVLAGQSIPGYGWGKSSPEEQNRRSVYIHVKRSLILPILETFDLAETDRTTPARFATTQPTQALAMLNSAFLNKQADVFAARLQREVGPEARRFVQRGLWLTLSRPPKPDEIERGIRFIETLQREGASPEVARRYFCLLLFNLNEFVYLN